MVGCCTMATTGTPTGSFDGLAAHPWATIWWPEERNFLPRFAKRVFKLGSFYSSLGLSGCHIVFFNFSVSFVIPYILDYDICSIKLLTKKNLNLLFFINPTLDLHWWYLVWMPLTKRQCRKCHWLLCLGFGGWGFVVSGEHFFVLVFWVMAFCP